MPSISFLFISIIISFFFFFLVLGELQVLVLYDLPFIEAALARVGSGTGVMREMVGHSENAWPGTRQLGAS